MKKSLTFIAGTHKGKRATHCQKIELPDDFRQKYSKRRQGEGEGRGMDDVLENLNYQFSGSNKSRATTLVFSSQLTSST